MLWYCFSLAEKCSRKTIPPALAALRIVVGDNKHRPVISLASLLSRHTGLDPASPIAVGVVTKGVRTPLFAFRGRIIQEIAISRDAKGIARLIHPFRDGEMRFIKDFENVTNKAILIPMTI